MKKPLIKILAKRILMLLFILSAFESFGQTYYTYALTDKFRRLGKYHVENDVVTTVADTITLQEAKSIIAINAVRTTNVKSEQNYILVENFILLIADGKKIKSIKSDTDQLTPYMRNELQTISSGTTLTFKDISIKTYDGITDVPKQTVIFIVR